MPPRRHSADAEHGQHMNTTATRKSTFCSYKEHHTTQTAATAVPPTHHIPDAQRREQWHFAREGKIDIHYSKPDCIAIPLMVHGHALLFPTLQQQSAAIQREQHHFADGM